MLPTPSRVLIIRPSALGDVCRSVPVLASLRRRYPDAAIDWLVQEGFEDAVRHHPALTGVVGFPRARLSHWHRPAVMRDVLGWLGSLRERRYDLVIDCQGLARSGVFSWATRAEVRIGDRNSPEFAWLGANRRVRAPRGMHTVDRMLALLEPLGVPPVRDMRLYAPFDAIARVAMDPELSTSRYAVIAPTSRWPGKLWPPERFAAVAKGILESGAVDRVVIVGARSERGQIAPLLGAAAGDARLIDRVGTTSIGDLMALIARAALVIGSDSGAVHMAVGFHRPLVALYGPTRVDLVGPYQRPESVVQRITANDVLDHKDSAAGAALMARITVEDVLAKVSEVMSVTSAPAG